MEKIIYQVDAFTNKPFGGNPAAVVMNAENLNGKQMLDIAREMALSETAFIKKSNTKNYDYEVRFFTPTEEVDLCGHATVASFFLMVKKGMIEPRGKKVIVKQKTLAGILPVEIYFEDYKVDKIMMIQKKPEYIYTVKDIDSLAKIMGISKYEIGLDGFISQPMAYSTGLPDIMLPVRDIDILKRIKPNYEELKNYSKANDVVGVHAFTIKNYNKNIITCRNFAPAYGINEEAATGTSNGALAAYLINNDIISIDKSINLVCEQGYFMNRPSQIYVKAIKDRDDLIIKVGGKAVIVMEGKIYL